MDVKCCKCKKEYDLGDNIFGYNKANCPILICPHCGFKHLINFMPFENRIENLRKVKKIELATNYPLLGASRIADASRVDQSHSDNASINFWEIGTAVYANKSKDVTSQETVPHGVFFKPDGLKMYVIGTSSDSVLQYALTTAWDPSTASYEGKATYVGGQGTYPSDVFFKSDGSKMYVVFNSWQPSFVAQYNLTVAWDVSTGSYSGKSVDVSVEAAEAKGIFLSSDGTKMYIASTYPDNGVFQYTLSSAWDVSTALYANKSVDVGDEESSPSGVFFRSDGLKMYVVGTATDSVFQYTLSTPWDVSTASYDNKAGYVGDEDILPYGIFISPDGTKMYMVGNTNNTVFQYDLASAWVKTNDFILATRIYGSKGVYNFAYKLKWRNVTDGGVFADIGATGEISFNANTVLVDGQALAIGNKICGPQSGYSWQNGMENEGDNLLPDSGTYSLADEYYTELQWALDCNSAHDEDEYEFAIYELSNGTSIGTCLARIAMGVAGGIQNTTGKASISSSIISVLSRGKIEDITAKASMTSNIDSILSRGKIENAIGNSNISSLIQIILSNYINASGGSSIDTDIEIILSRGRIENVTGETSITSFVDSILSRGKIEDVSGKVSISSNVDSILSRGKIENITGKVGITSSMTSIIRGIYAAQGKVSISSIVISILSRGEIENVSGKVDVTSIISSILYRIKKANAKSPIITSIDSLLSRGKVESVSGKADITTSIISVLSRGKIETVSGKASINTTIVSILNRGKIENADGKSSIDTDILIILSRGIISDVSGKSSINSIIDIALSEGEIKSIYGKANIISDIIIALNRGIIEDVSGITSIITLIDSALSRGKIEVVSGKNQINTNIDIILNRIISVNGKAILDTLCDIIISRGKLTNVNGKVYIYTSIGSILSRYLVTRGKANIDSLINIPLKGIFRGSGKSIFDTLIEIEVFQQFAFTEATLGITENDSLMLIKKIEAISRIKKNDSSLLIKEIGSKFDIINVTAKTRIKE